MKKRIYICYNAKCRMKKEYCFRMLSGNPRLFNCRDESAKRFSGEFEKQEDIECVFEIFLLFLYVYGILCV